MTLCLDPTTSQMQNGFTHLPHMSNPLDLCNSLHTPHSSHYLCSYFCPYNSLSRTFPLSVHPSFGLFPSPLTIPSYPLHKVVSSQNLRPGFEELGFNQSLRRDALRNGVFFDQRFGLGLEQQAAAGDISRTQNEPKRRRNSSGSGSSNKPERKALRELNPNNGYSIQSNFSVSSPERFSHSSINNGHSASTSSTIGSGSGYPSEPQTDSSEGSREAYHHREGIWNPFFTSLTPRQENISLLDRENMKVAKKPKKYQCSECSRMFNRKSNLERHYRLHTGERPFKCRVCDASFTQIANLNYHARIHEGSRPYSCPVCNMPFRSSSHVTRHMRKHTGERPYFCTICPETFTSWDQRKRHLLKEHNFSEQMTKSQNFKSKESNGMSTWE